MTTINVEEPLKEGYQVVVVGHKDKLNKIKAAITAMYEKAQDAPFIEDYLEARKNDYRIPESGLIEDIDWIRDLLAEVKVKIREAYELALENLKICETDAEEYLENAKADKELLEGLLECSAYDDFREGLTAEFVRKSSKKGPNEEARQKFSNNRDLIKKEYIGPLKTGISVQTRYITTMAMLAGIAFTLFVFFNERPI